MEINELALKNDLKNYTRSFAIAYAKKAADEITSFAKQAINQFYNDYTPKYYNRTENLLKNSYSRYYKNNGRVAEGGVRIHVDKMTPYKNGASAMDVATRTWLRGYHGYLNRDPSNRIQTFPPISMVQIAMGDRKFLDGLLDHAHSIAKSQKYSVLDVK